MHDKDPTFLIQDVSPEVKVLRELVEALKDLREATLAVKDQFANLNNILLNGEATVWTR